MPSRSPTIAQTTRRPPQGARPALDDLRQQIARLEGASASLGDGQGESGKADGAAANWHFAMAAIDAALPPDGLACDGLHDVVARTANDVAAATAFILALIARHPKFMPAETRPILWCQSRASMREAGRIFAHGSAHFGFGHARILFVTVQRAADALWVLEEAARSGAVLAAVGETPDMSFKQTQRLSRAAAEGQTPLFCLRLPSAATNGATSSRWRVAAAVSRHVSSSSEVDAAPKTLCWDVALERCRRGRPGAWSLEWSHETHRFGLVPGVCNRPVQASPAHGVSGPGARCAG